MWWIHPVRRPTCDLYLNQPRDSYASARSSLVYVELTSAAGQLMLRLTGIDLPNKYVPKKIVLNRANTPIAPFWPTSNVSSIPYRRYVYRKGKDMTLMLPDDMADRMYARCRSLAKRGANCR